MTVNDVVSALGLNGVPKLFMLSNEDVDRYQGHKAVLAIMATNRNHPEFKKAEQSFSTLEEHDDLIIITEDHADGAIHERFECGPREFCFALVDKAGNTVMRGEQIPSLQEVRQRLQLDPVSSKQH